MITFFAPGGTKNNFLPVRIDNTDNFNDAILLNDILIENITGILPGDKVIIYAVSIISVQNNEFDLYFFDSNLGEDDLPSLHAFQSRVNLDIPAVGTRIGAPPAGNFLLEQRLNVPIRYQDLDGVLALNIGLVPRTLNKLAAAPGAVSLKFWMAVSL